MDTFDVVIIGGGPGGAAAAKELASAGKSVAIIENAQWGGTCLNCGCIPTKMLLGATSCGAQLRAQKRLKTLSGDVAVDYAALQTRIGRFLKGSSQTLAKSLAGLGVTLLEGVGTVLGKGQVAFTAPGEAPRTLSCSHIILACGSSSASFPGLTPDHDCVLDSTDLLQIPAIPESLVIVGAGAIGLEMADFFAAMGSKVTVVEAAPHIAPLEDADIAKEMLRAVSKNGIECLEGVKASSLRTVDGHAELTLEDGRVIAAAKALVAVGRRPNTAGLDAEKAGCSLNRRGYVEVNENLEAAPDVYAVGDVNGVTLLAHAAEHQAAYVARRICGKEQGAYVPGPVPSCIYGSVELMRVGDTAAALLAQGKAVEVSQAPLTINPIAQAYAGTAGMVKAVWSDGKLMGIAAVGHGVSHLVTVAQLLIKEGYTVERLHEIMFAHPTLDEIVPAALRAPRTSVTA